MKYGMNLFLWADDMHENDADIGKFKENGI